MTPAQVAHIMPPLPKPLTLSRGDEDGAIQLGYTAEQMQAYARAAVEAALRDAPQQAEPVLTDEQLKRHSLLAADCPGASAVILASTVRRLAGITTQEPTA